MPLDLELSKSQAETTLEDLLKKRIIGVPGDIEGIRQKVEGTRDLSAPVSPYLQNLGLQASGISGLSAKKSNTLSQELAKQLSKTGFNRNRTLMGYKGDQVNRRVNEAYGNRVGATDFARSQQRLTGQQNFEAGQSALDRQAALDREATAADFQNREIAMQNAYADSGAQSAYEAALARILSGTLGAVGTATALKYKYPSTSTPSATPTPTVAGVNPNYDPYNPNLSASGGGTAGTGGY